MCGGSAPKDNSADIARQQEEERTGRIRAGQANIDKIFDGSQIGDALASAYDPTGKYYNADGSAWTPTAQTTSQGAVTGYYGMSGEGHNKGDPIYGPSTTSGKTAAEQAADLISQGKLYSSLKSDGKGFNDDYFGNIAHNYENYYDPQLNDQYDEAVKQLTFNLARSGNAQSSTNNEQFGKLTKAQLDARTKIADDAAAAAGKARGDVASQRSNLYTLNNAAADPTQASSQAAQAALTLNQPVSYSPLGQVFASLIQNGGNAAAIQNGQNTNFYGNGGYNTNQSGSGKVVSN